MNNLPVSAVCRNCCPRLTPVEFVGVFTPPSGGLSGVATFGIKSFPRLIGFMIGSSLGGGRTGLRSISGSIREPVAAGPTS